MPGITTSVNGNSISGCSRRRWSATSPFSACSTLYPSEFSVSAMAAKTIGDHLEDAGPNR
jgi:hypothetical protein